MGEHYSQIDFAERRRIQEMRDAKMPVTVIALAIRTVPGRKVALKMPTDVCGDICLWASL